MFSADTQVFTEKGWLPWPMVNLGIPLACRLQGSILFARPCQVIRRPYHGAMVVLSTETGPGAMVTSTSRVWSDCGRKPIAWKELPIAQMLRRRTVLVLAGSAPHTAGSVTVYKEDLQEDDMPRGMVYGAVLPGGLAFVRRSRSQGLWVASAA